ncbi:duboraya isoform X2 [Sardina pilchardus]|uniref:duboraya isoform X2 n=1 Tax=Sardina pilchardus TaxID=27697 RepID=UPI002E0D5EC2
MEGNPVIKVSVAELAGKFKDHSVSSCAGYDGNKPVRRRPPRTLQIPAKGDESQTEEQKCEGAAARPARSRNRNSALIEKLQSNLALSPMALSPAPLLPSPKSPGLRLPSPICPSSPVAPVPRANKQELEAPASFESPAAADAALLPSINKGRARLSVRRRPPSRRVKKSGEEEMDGEGDGRSSSPLEPADGEREATHTTETHTAEKHTDGRGVPHSETKAVSVKEPEVVDKAKARVKPADKGEADDNPVDPVKAADEGKAQLRPVGEACRAAAAAADTDGAGEPSTADSEGKQDGPSEHEKQDGPSELVKQDGPSEHEKQDGPSEHEKQDGPSEHEKQDGPSEPEKQDGPSEPEKQDGPSEPEKQDGPSEHEKQDGPSEHEKQDGLSEHEKQDGPSEPSADLQQPGTVKQEV